MRRETEQSPENICDQRETGTGSQAGAFIPKHWDILIKYCSRQTLVISSGSVTCDVVTTGQMTWWRGWWHAPVLACTSTGAAAGIRVSKGGWDFNSDKTSYKSEGNDQWPCTELGTIHQNTDGGRGKCCFCRSIFIEDKNRTKCSILGDLRQWGLGWGEKLWVHYKVISVVAARDRPRSLEKIQMRKTWE